MEQLANFIALFFLAHFIWSYYWNCYRKGYRFDMWHFVLFFGLLSIHLMLPFTRSDLNVYALGPILLRHMQPFVTTAYLISAFGYGCLVLGGNLWRLQLGVGLRRLFSELVELPSSASLFLLNSRNLLVVHGFLACLLMAGVLLYYFRVAGFGFNLRGLLLVQPGLRPIAQFSAFYSILIGSYCLARYARTKDRAMLIITLSIMVGLAFFGERANYLGVVTMTGIVAAISMRRRLRIAVIAVTAFFGMVLVVFLDAIRQPHFSLGDAVAGSMLSLFYGNSFSDTRDFALILSFWDGKYMWGLTYLAGILAFVPRFVSDFRGTWSIGVVTATLAGFNPAEHPGLRVGIFGEAYLNFGLVGVLLLGLFAGATVRLIDMRLKQSVAGLPHSGMRVYSYFIMAMVVSAAENTSAASAFYSVLVILFVSWAAMKTARLLKTSTT